MTTVPPPLRVVLASSFLRDERLGSSKVPLRLAAELRALGVEVTTVFAEDLPKLPHPRLAQVAGAVQMARALAARAADADVVDIAGGDGWAYALWARRRRPTQAVVARSNGLWYRGLQARARRGGDPRPRLWQALSNLYQQQVPCRWERESIRQADMAIFGAAIDGQQVVTNGWKRPEQVAVIPPGADSFFDSAVPLDSRSGMFFIGTFINAKGGDVAAAAFGRVLARLPEATATFVGPAVPDEEILNRFDPAVRGRVRIVAKVPATQVAREIAAGAVLAFPSQYEGFGMVVLEAMRAGLVVVSTPTGAGAEVVRDGVNGLVVPFSDVEATAAAIERLLVDAPLRMRLASAAIAEARPRTWELTATQLMQAYRTAIGLAAARARGL